MNELYKQAGLEEPVPTKGEVGGLCKRCGVGRYKLSSKGNLYCDHICWKNVDRSKEQYRLK